MSEVGSVIDFEGICLRLDRLVKDAGSQRKFCAAKGISEGHLSDALAGAVTGRKILASVGVEAEVITVYRVVKPEADCRIQKEPAHA